MCQIGMARTPVGGNAEEESWYKQGYPRLPLPSPLDAAEPIASGRYHPIVGLLRLRGRHQSVGATTHATEARGEEKKKTSF